LTQVIIPPLPDRSGIEYIRFSSSSVVDKPCVGVSVRISLDEGRKTCQGARVVLGCVAPIPMRARKAERVLEGKPLRPERVQEAARSAAEECSPTSDLRGSEQYKRAIVLTLVRRAAQCAYERALTS